MMLYKGQSKYRKKKITPHFTVGEIVCKDGSPEYIINGAVLEGLEKLRAIIGKPIIINSAYRTPEYNAKVGGSPRSQHMLGNAVDFHVKGMNTTTVYEILRKNGFLGKVFTGVGVYNSFVHVDVRPNPHPRGFSQWDMRK